MTDPTPPKPSNGELAASAKRARRKGWMWFFAILFGLSFCAICVQIWYNVRNQLTVEQLDQARVRWNTKGPASYDLEYTIRKLDSTETYDVKVRNGKAVSVTRDGQLLEDRLFAYSEMRALFGFIEEFLQQDSQPGQPRTFASATFDADDGHLLRYVRSVAVKGDRQEITVTRFERVSGSSR